MLKPNIITEEDEKDGKTKILTKMHIRNSDQGLCRRKQQAKNKQTKAKLLEHKN